MNNVTSFNDEITSLRSSYNHSSFEYCNGEKTFTSHIDSHFKGIKDNIYGVYIIRQKDSGKVIYIGKAGTINRNGNFEGQDIPGRLGNVRNQTTTANEWFRGIYEEFGCIEIEYIVLDKSHAPALIEAVLLQAYLNDNDRLPARNREF